MAESEKHQMKKVKKIQKRHVAVEEHMENQRQLSLQKAYTLDKVQPGDMLVKEGVSLTMKGFPGVVDSLSFEAVKKVIQLVKDIGNWDPKCDHASEALEKAYMHQKYDVFDVLVQEGVSLTMKNFPGVVDNLSFECVMKLMRHLKDTYNWDPKCGHASEALEKAYVHCKYDVCDLLIMYGVSLTMKSLPRVVDSLSFEDLKKVIQHMKDTDNWYPKCDHASEALEKAYMDQKYDVRDVLVQEGVSVKSLPGLVDRLSLESGMNIPIAVTGVQFDAVKKEMQHLHGNGSALKVTGLPPEILRMDEQSQQLYREALEAGKVKVYNIRLMIVGHLGVGKTTLTRCILGEKVEKAPHVPTEGIEVHPRCCKINLDDGTNKWIVEQKELHYPDCDQSLVNIVSEYVGNKGKNSKDDVYQEVMNRNEQLIGPIEVSVEPDQEMSKSDVMQNVQTDPNATTNMRVINDTNIHSDFHKFVTRCGTMIPLEKTFSYVTMLDFAGEFVFYTTHQMFMSWRTIYLLVTDINKSLNVLVKEDKFSMNRSIQDYVIYWFNSIYSHGMPSNKSPHCEGRTQLEKENDQKYPPVIMVATHSDQLPEGEKNKIKEEYFDGVRRILKDRPQRFLLKGTFAISNFGPADDINALKQKIFEVARQQDYWGFEIPGTWLALEQKLMESKTRGEKIIEYSRVEKINTSSDVKIKKPEELEVFLRFEHDLGNIVFFNTEQLRANVVLDPVWLMDGVRNLITPKPSMIEDHPDILPQWYKFKDTGQLTESLIGHLWSGDGHEDFDKNRKYLLDLMEKLSIIVKPVKKDGDKQDQEPYYWVPCVICNPAPADVKNRNPCESITKTSTLCFVSKMKFIHVGVFHRLVASFLSMWLPVKEDEKEDKYCLYSDCCEFQVDPCHSLLLIMNDFVILVTMFRCSSKKEDPDNGLCSQVKNHISSMLYDISTCICPNLEFDICVKCGQSSTDTINELLPSSVKGEMTCRCIKYGHPVDVENLMKFWEKKDNCQQKQEEEKSHLLNAQTAQDDTMHHDSPGLTASVSPMPPPPAGDTDRFMRITYLLVDIGARVLRQLLSHHTVTSTCTLDQYLAKEKKTIDKLTRVFNKSLMAIMFPSNGDDTNLNDYDITLLSALFNNVVPSLSQKEKDLIQNLRDDRNKLIAHAKSCQINASDFETHWKDISSTLITLSQQCGDKAFEDKIVREIQHTRISAIPAGSYLDILKAWFDMIETVKEELQKSVKDEVQKSVKDEVQKSVKDEVQKSVKDEIQKSVKDEVQKSVKDEVQKSVKDEIQKSVKDEVQKSVKDEIQKSVKDEVQNVTSRLQALESKEKSSAGISKNLGVQNEIQGSTKDQAGNMKAVNDETETVFNHTALVQCAKSVGIIRSPSTCGTGFRVGPHYIMTAKHVIDQIMMGTAVTLQPPMQIHPYHPLSNANVFIDFSYERDGLPSDENQRFYFEPEIVYTNADLDTVILKLKPDSKEYPPPLNKFHDVAHSLQHRSDGYFIGHSRANIKKTDRYQFSVPTSDTITAAKKWSLDLVNVDGYVGIDDPNRILFNCTFERGASGAPGIWICLEDGNAYVELMLLCGYPSWYYDDNYKGKTIGIHPHLLVEQGVTMKSVYEDMQKRNEPLLREIFQI